MGWDKGEKWAEIFHKFSRFILVFQGSEPVASNLVAFTMFRFEMEDNYTVLYWCVPGKTYLSLLVSPTDGHPQL